MKRMKLLTLLPLIFTTFACNEIDTSKSSEWQYISIGQSKAEVIRLMGKPISENSINILGIELERLEWKSDLYSKSYQVDMAFNKVVSKQFSK